MVSPSSPLKVVTSWISRLPLPMILRRNSVQIFDSTMEFLHIIKGKPFQSTHCSQVVVDLVNVTISWLSRSQSPFCGTPSQVYFKALMSISYGLQGTGTHFFLSKPLCFSSWLNLVFAFWNSCHGTTSIAVLTCNNAQVLSNGSYCCGSCLALMPNQLRHHSPNKLIYRMASTYYIFLTTHSLETRWNAMLHLSLHKTFLSSNSPKQYISSLRVYHHGLPHNLH